MQTDQMTVACDCLRAAQDGSLGFPQIIGRLMEAGFEGYAVDYRRDSQTFYLPDGGSLVLGLHPTDGHVAAAFDANSMAAQVRWAQSGAADYSYAAFCTRAKAAGCAGYLVSFPGRRVVYYGRTAETHVEHFPS